VFLYVKLFASILDSSVWCEPKDVRVLWVSMLAMADRDGIVRASPPGLARRANLTSEECAKALLVLEAPDPISSSQEHEGRRVEPFPGGWTIFNYPLYRDLADADTRRIQTRDAVRRHRAKKASVSTSKQSYAHTDTTTDTTTTTKQSNPGTAVALRGEQGFSLRETAVQERSAQRKRLEAGLDLAADVVFCYWRDRLGKNPDSTILTEPRKKKLFDRLRENGGDVSEMLYVVDGTLKSDWHMGRAANSTTKYNDIETIFRDRGQVEKLRDLVSRRESRHPYLEQP
jgi:hypothetical protein